MASAVKKNPRAPMKPSRSERQKALSPRIRVNPDDHRKFTVLEGPLKGTEVVILPKLASDAYVDRLAEEGAKIDASLTRGCAAPQFQASPKFDRKPECMDHDEGDFIGWASRRAAEAKEDLINHPSHYTRGEIECIDAQEAALGHDGFVSHLRATIIGYLWRLPFKGEALKDSKKAKWYIDRLVATLEKHDTK
jgi:hypothetical protein